MFDIRVTENGEVTISGRLDAAQVEKARSILDTIDQSCVLNMKGLDYISSAGLGILLATQKRLMGSGHKIKIVNMSGHIRDIFHYTRFDTVFEIESEPTR
ncbi:MAG TPA: STAS domain-containing protein [Bacteroidota bacterium]|nr:STAS domain-containing protein [Bacteroidota bacterium]